MATITSLQNAQVRRVQRLRRSARRRRAEGVLIVEGRRLLTEALKVVTPTALFYTERFAATEEGAALLSELTAPTWRVTPSVMQALADTQTPQGILAIVPIPHLPLPEGKRFTLIPDQVRDPGNLGTILRTAWAAGVDQVLIPPGSVDPTNPKVVRAAMGAHFHLPWRVMGWEEIRRRLKGATVWLAEARSGHPYDEVDWRGDVAIIIGGEAEGAGQEGRALAGPHLTHIPMQPGVESLNAAIAAAIFLFAAARQRR